MERKRSRRLKLISWILTITMVASVFNVSVFAADSATSVTEQADVAAINGNWMSFLKDDTKLSQMTIPGTHDSGTNSTEVALKVNLFGQDIVNNDVRPYAQTQNTFIDQQLNMGIRALDLRYVYEDGKFKIYHGFEKGIQSLIVNNRCLDKEGNVLTYDTVFGWCQDFLKKHPSETILVKLSREGKDDQTELLEQLKAKYTAKDGSPLFINLDDPTGNSITLGEMRGHIVDATCNMDNSSGIYNNWSATADVKTQNMIECFSLAKSVKDPTVELKTIQTSTNTVPDKFIPVETLAKDVRQMLFDNYKPFDEFGRDKAYGIILFDFPQNYILRQLFDCNSWALKGNEDEKQEDEEQPKEQVENEGETEQTEQQPAKNPIEDEQKEELKSDKYYKLVCALEEAADNNALTNYSVSSGLNDFSNGAYKYNNNWVKFIYDNSGGYIYNVATELADVLRPMIAARVSGDDSNPYDLIQMIWSEIYGQYKAAGFKLTSDMLNLMHTIFFHEHYGEPENGKREGAGYVNALQTNLGYVRNKTVKDFQETFLGKDSEEGLKRIDTTYVNVVRNDAPDQAIQMSYNTKICDGTRTCDNWDEWYGKLEASFYARLYYSFNSGLTVKNPRADFTPDMKYYSLYKALTDAYNQGAFSEYTVSNGINSFSNGAEKNGNNWVKEICDNSGGYIYRVAQEFASIIQPRVAKRTTGKDSNPYQLVEQVYGELCSNYGTTYEVNGAMRNLLHTLFFHEHYGEADGAQRSGAGYVYDNQTSGYYKNANDALKQIDYTNIKVVRSDDSSCVLQMSYDTQRVEGNATVVEEIIYETVQKVVYEVVSKVVQKVVQVVNKVISLFRSIFKTSTKTISETVYEKVARTVSETVARPIKSIKNQYYYAFNSGLNVQSDDPFKGDKYNDLVKALDDANYAEALTQYTVSKGYNDFSNGAYKSGNDWKKTVTDNSGGYIYNIAEEFAKVVKPMIANSSTGDKSNPYQLVESVWDEIVAKGYGAFYGLDEAKMKNILHTILYHEHYGEPGEGQRSGAGYVYDDQTNQYYAKAGDALELISNSSVTVVRNDDSNCKLQMSYNTKKVKGKRMNSTTKYKYYYAFNSGLTVK